MANVVVSRRSTLNQKPDIPLLGERRANGVVQAPCRHRKTKRRVRRVLLPNRNAAEAFHVSQIPSKANSSACHSVLIFRKGSWASTRMCRIESIHLRRHQSDLMRRIPLPYRQGSLRKPLSSMAFDSSCICFGPMAPVRERQTWRTSRKTLGHVLVNQEMASFVQRRLSWANFVRGDQVVENRRGWNHRIGRIVRGVKENQ